MRPQRTIPSPHELPNPKPQVTALSKAEAHLAKIPSIIYEEEEESVELFPQKVKDNIERAEGIPMLDLTGEGKKRPPGQVCSLQIPPRQIFGKQAAESSSPTFGERTEPSPYIPNSSSPLPPIPSEVPTQHAPGKSVLLRQLRAKKEKQQDKQTFPVLKHISEASTLKFNSTLSTPQHRHGLVNHTEEIERVDFADGTFRLNGYIAGEKLDSGELLGCWYRGEKDGEKVVICEYRKRELKRVMVKRKENGLAALLNQIEVLTNCDHPNLVALTDILNNPDKDQLYLVLRLDYSSTLLSLAPLSEASAWGVYRQMLEAVLYLHEERRVVHSELEPSSFVVDAAGVVKLCWVLTPQAGGNPGTDLFHLVAIFFELLFRKQEARDQNFPELLQILHSEQ